MKRRLSYLLVLPLILFSTIGASLLRPETVKAATASDAQATTACKAMYTKQYGTPASQQPSSFPWLNSCKYGYVKGYANPNNNDATTACQSDPNSNPGVCEEGYRQGQQDANAASGTKPPSTSTVSADAARLCKPYQTQSGVDSATQQANFQACVTGYKNKFAGKDVNTACQGITQQTHPCLAGYQAALDGKTVNPPAAVNPGNQTTPPASTSNNGATSPQCEDSGYALSWILCKVINGLSDGVDWFYNTLVQPLLLMKPIDLSNNPNDPTHTFAVWSNFRVYGDIFLVIALLVIVYGESIGGGLIDAYTIKKILPRLLIAAILINLSIYIVAIAVDISNIVGKGIGNLIEAPFKAQIGSGNFYTLNIGAGAGTVGGGALTLIVGGAFGLVLAGHAAVLGAGLMYFLVMFLLPAFLIMVAILGTVVLRRGLILLLIFLAPVAFALYCLPNTEKYFRQWWDLLFKALLVFPIIAAMFALGNVLSVTISSASTGLAGVFAQLLGAVSMFVPLFLIPFSFRIAGGLLGRFHELATNTAKRSHQGILGNVQDQDSLRNRAKRRFGIERNEAGLTGRATTARLRRPQDLLTQEGRARRRSGQAAIREAGRTRFGGQFAESDLVYQANQKNDQYLLAVANEGLAQQKRQAALRAGNTTEAAAWNQAIDAARATPRNAATRMRAVQDLAATGFQFDAGQEGYDQLARTVADITGAELQTDAAGHAVGATGTNAGAYANAMNQAQYNLRTAGRFELGGINNGERYDSRAGTNKASLYELANAKPESVRTMVADLGPGPIGHDHAVVYKELEAMLPNAKGAVRDEIVTQMATLNTGGAMDTYMNAPDATATAPKKARVSYDPAAPGAGLWSTEDRARGWRIETQAKTQGDRAQQEARNYERPDPNNL